MAQEYAFTGVGLLAGSSILLLTLVWGTCVITGAQQFSNDLTLRTCCDGSNLIPARLKAYFTSMFHLTTILGHWSIYDMVSNSKNYFLDMSDNLVGLIVGYGITTDLETSQTARIMLASVIPLIIMQIPNLFQFSSVPRTVTLIVALIITAIFLLMYFTYQVVNHHISQ